MHFYPLHNHFHWEDPLGHWSANGTWILDSTNTTNVTAAPVTLPAAPSGDCGSSLQTLTPGPVKAVDCALSSESSAVARVSQTVSLALHTLHTASAFGPGGFILRPGRGG